MDLRLAPGNGDDNVGLPDDMRCKRSDGKQWRCTARSMPDKTVCEKHYIQAKKRAANSALRANMKKAKRKPSGENDTNLESRSDDFDAQPPTKSDDIDVPLESFKSEEKSRPSHGKKFTKISKNQFRYSPDPPPMRSVPRRNLPNDERKSEEHEDDWNSYKSPPVSALDSPGNRPQRSFDANAMAVSESADGSSESSEDAGGQTCHQCRRKDDSVIWCHRCDRRGYCDSCIRTWYSNTPPEDIQSSCPACSGTCNCKVCLRRDNLVKVRIREIPALDKLQYLHCLLSSVLPVVKQIHQEQCFEVELERKLRGSDIDLARTKLNADEQMCCNFCRIPIIDYHWHCSSCAYDVCLNCCLDLREASKQAVKGEESEEIEDESQEKETMLEQFAKVRLNFMEKFPNWKANSNGSIPCPPKEYGGCGYSALSLSRIFKMNWVAKLVKNAEEMVSGCRVNDAASLERTEVNDPRFCQYAHREDSDNFLYCPSSEDIKCDGIATFKRHWLRGEPIIVKGVFDSSTVSSWDPAVIWRGIQKTTDEKSKDQNRVVKAIDCYDWSEVDIELGHFIEGYSEGQIYENGQPKILKLKDWPSPSASEEFLLYQRPEFIRKLPLLEYIHSKFGLLNVAAKLPHYSLQNDVGPKIFISYGTHEELDKGNSVTNLHFNMRDMVYLLVHACEVKQKGQQKAKIENVQKPIEESEVKESHEDLVMGAGDRTLPNLSIDQNEENPYAARLDTDKVDSAANHGIETTQVEMNTINCEHSEKEGDGISQKTHPGVLWDVFRRKDVPKLTEYLRIHGEEFGKLISETNNLVTRPLYDETFFLNEHHKRKLKEEFGIEPWSFEQNLGQAIFVPAGCPFQVRNLQSTVQLGLDFLSPESLGDAARLAEEIRCLPNDHEAKQQVLEVGQGKFHVEVGKISLYAASSAIKEIQRLVLDPKFSGELGFEDPNLTAAVSENLEKINKRRQIACS